MNERNHISWAVAEERVVTTDDDFWWQPYYTPWAEGCRLDEGCYPNAHVACRESRWPLCRYLFHSKAFMLRLEHHCVVEGEIDAVCFKESFFQAVQVLMRLIWKWESDTVGESDVLAAEKVLVCGINGIGDRQTEETVMRCPAKVLFYKVFSCLHYAFPLKLLQRPLVVWHGEAASVTEMVRIVAGEVLSNSREHIAVCWLRESRCDHEEVTD